MAEQVLEDAIYHRHMSEEKSLDLLGAGKLAKAVPAVAWKRAVETACVTFERVMAPITETTGGIGRLISAKFDRLVAAEKIILVKTVEEAEQKTNEAKLPLNPTINHLVITKVIEHAQAQAEPNIRGLWSNLLAREFTSGQVHPEIVDVLGRLTTEDAILLTRFSKKPRATLFWVLKNAAAISSVPSILFFGKGRTPPSLSHLVLGRLGLIKWTDETGWMITAFGRAFLAAVSPLEKVSSPAK